jgi:hypothetical protein
VPEVYVSVRAQGVAPDLACLALRARHAARGERHTTLDPLIEVCLWRVAGRPRAFGSLVGDRSPLAQLFA